MSIQIHVPLLDVQDLAVSYRDKTRKIIALDQVSFTLEEGEVVCALGPNGAGKTTLLKCLAGLAIPCEGEISWRQADGSHGRSRPPLGVLLEGSRAFYWNLTGLENARYFATLKGLSPSPKTEDHLTVLFELLDLSMARECLAGTYSTGMKKRLSLLIALLGAPAMLLLDEPTQGLDPEAAASLGEYLTHIASIGTSILCASHDVNFVLNFATRVFQLEAGRLCPYDWRAGAGREKQVAFLLAGEMVPERLPTVSLVPLSNGCLRLVGPANDPDLYRMLENLLAQRQARVVQIYEVK